MQFEAADFKQIELGPLPNDWEVKALRDVTSRTVQIDPRGTPDRCFRYIDVSCVSSETLRIEGASEVTGSKAPSRARKLVLSGDVIFATVRPYLRRVARVPPELGGHIVSTAFCVIRAVPHLTDPTFLFFAVSSPTFVARVAEQQQGSSYPAVSDAQVLNQPIPLPPLPEQRAIAQALGAVQETVEARRRELVLERERKAALMQHLFTHGTRGEARKQTEIGEVPESWEVVRLGDVSHLSTGTTPSTKESAYYSGTIPFVRTADILNNIINCATAHISEQAVRDYGLKRYAPGTVMMAMYGQGKTRGQVALLGIAATTTQNTAAIVPAPHLDSTYLWNYLMSQYERLRNAGMHGQISHLNLGFVRELLIPLPSLSEQHLISTALDVGDTKIRTLEREVKITEELFQAMLEDLMTGRLRATGLIEAVVG